MYTTKINIPESPIKITYYDNILTLGSCFSENIGNKLNNSFFTTDINPFGVLYNPASIKNSLQILLSDREFDKKDLFQNNSLWHSFAYSSTFSAPVQDLCLQKINTRLKESRKFIKDTKFILITFGTARVYEHSKYGKIVSNCHKLPAKEFNHYCLSIEDIVTDYKQLLSTINSQMPDVHIIFTLSPIRHWKDGAHENNISKSILLLAINALQKEFSNISYFPAYEILLDELRDYRYYASDMLHPSETAVNYIWERFADCYFSSETLSITNELKQLVSDFSHKALHPESESFKRFILNTQAKKKYLEDKYPFLNERINKLNKFSESPK